MARLWLTCMLTLIAFNLVTGKLGPAVTDENVGVQPMPPNDLDCGGDSHLCDSWQGVTCCLYRGVLCDLGLCLDIKGGNGNFLRNLLPELPAENITFLRLTDTDLFDQQACNSLCVLSNLKSLFDTVYNTGLHLDTCTCLTQLRDLTIKSESISITNTSFQSMNHVVSIEIDVFTSSLSTEGMMQLQGAKELIDVVIYTNDHTALDVWPLCVAQTHPGITISFAEASIMCPITPSVRHNVI